MTLYISGPMAGYPEHNFPAFQRAKDILTAQGYNVFSPHDVDHGTSVEWTDFLRHDLALMVKECDGIALLQRLAAVAGGTPRTCHGPSVSTGPRFTSTVPRFTA